MDGADSVGDDRTFLIDFTGEGALRLQDRVKEKLKEFMGDYTDDTLVEYVIVLLKNGRRKDEARRELNVFLGDDSDSFVSWLWDHLSSNLHLYVEQESFPDKVPRINPIDELSGRHGSQPDCASGNVQTDAQYERERTSKPSRSRRNREWKGLVHETNLFPLRSTVTEILRSERTQDRPNLGRKSPSPIPQVRKKRGRQDEGQPKMREMASYPIIGAPRRLLQFAVRDAVKTVQQSSSRTEPVLKRLRSVISMSAPDSVPDERPQRTTPVVRMPGLSTALKAAAEAAEDVTKVRHSGSVFDRLEHSTESAEPINQSPESRVPVLEDGEYEDCDQIPGSTGVDYYLSSRYGGESTGDMTMLDQHDEITADSASDNEGYDNVTIVQRGDVSQSALSANKERNPLNMQYTVAQDADEVVRKTRLIDQGSSASTAAKTSSKILNISVNVNTWKPPHYQESRDITGAENQMSVDKNEVSAGKHNVRVQKENDTAMTENENVTARADVKESQKTSASTSGSYTASRPSEDPESRTVFVSNVHFAATKDTLSRHFNKFGEVLKVIIVTDATTGQPTGSAYVEFLRKESVELALSLNGASFMSRILKVVRRSSAHHDAGPMLGWPRISRASPFASRLTRMAYPRGAMAGAFRARLPIKPGARSLQWKRGASTAQITEATKGLQNASLSSGSNIASPTGRNLTYVRTDQSKTDGNPAPA